MGKSVSDQPDKLGLGFTKLSLIAVKHERIFQVAWKKLRIILRRECTSLTDARAGLAGPEVLKALHTFRCCEGRRDKARRSLAEYLSVQTLYERKLRELEAANNALRCTLQLYRSGPVTDATLQRENQLLKLNLYSAECDIRQGRSDRFNLSNVEKRFHSCLSGLITSYNDEKAELPHRVVFVDRPVEAVVNSGALPQGHPDVIYLASEQNIGEMAIKLLSYQQRHPPPARLPSRQPGRPSGRGARRGRAPGRPRGGPSPRWRG